MRVRLLSRKPVRRGGAFVLYWMLTARRTRLNYALDRIAWWSTELSLPIVVVEPLLASEPYASDRLHRFALQGMADNARALEPTPVRYHPYVEPVPGAAEGLLARVSRDAAVIVTDEYPCGSVPAFLKKATDEIAVRLEAVDSNGLLPLWAVPRAYPAAVHFRRYMQGCLRTHLRDLPSESPFASLPRATTVLPADVTERWPAASPALLRGEAGALAALAIDHKVPPVAMTGGSQAAGRALQAFVRDRLPAYHERHNHPDDRGTSRLSPYLHFGHISAHDVFNAVMRAERWTIGDLGAQATGVRTGWWGVGPGAEAFLDQLVVWRELGFNTCTHRPHDYDRFEGLPPWAQETLIAHAGDPRPAVYDRQTFEKAATHDALWNAAQREMLTGGWMHNYMRMLWGKKILEWSASPQEALDVMTRLMNRWCLDGRDPNSYAGYSWTLGRYDRPWPERPVFGVVRAMSSASAEKKVRVRQYLSGGLSLL
ncbi:MAG: deoxyribodipyrimidine photolyase [Vicinamibacterales bacterium]